jgi:hypothetical protein
MYKMGQRKNISKRERCTGRKITFLMQRPKMESKIIHVITGIIFLILALITLREFLFGDSMLIYRDVTEFDPKSYLYHALNVFDLESTRRILYLGPFISMTTMLGLSSLTAQKLSFLVGHFMIGFLAYIAGYKFLLSRVTHDNHKKFIFIAALIFGFFYLYNPLMAQGLGMIVWAHAFSYSLIPLIFYYYDKSLRDARFSNILITSVLISLALAGTAQFLVGLPFFILLPWLLFVCIRKLKFREPVFPAIRTSLLIFSLWFAISFYWIYMSLRTIGSGVTVQPGYVLTNQFLDIFSSTASLSNVLRLMPSWWPYINIEPDPPGFVWTSLTLVIPIAVVLSILFLKYDKLKFELIIFALTALFIVFLAKGTQEPLPELYPFLYDIPLVGWMFRNPPTSIAIYLPFYFGMIITFGIYSLLRLRLKNTIQNCIKFACPAILVVSIAFVGWPLFTGDFGGAYEDNNKFVGNTWREESYHIDAPSESIMVFGDLNKLNATASLFPTNYSSLIMTGHDLDILQQNKIIPDKVILDNKEDLLFYFLDNNSVLIEPFTSTRNHDPSKVWSVAGTDDPLHGPFHGYLEEDFRINNTDTDYNKGLVFTWDRDKLHIPLEVKGKAEYHLFARYLESEAGGEMKVSLNGRTVSIFTKSLENKFVWKDIGTFDLPNGKHTLMLENHIGLNAVNIFVLIPSYALTELNDKVGNFINRNKLIYILDNDDLIFVRGSGRTIIDEHSNQTLLRIDPQSTAYRPIDVAKTSNYLIAINAMTCKECQTLNVSIGSVYKQFSLQNNTEGFRWLYLPVTLEAGKTNLRLYSEEGAYISRVLIQSDNDEQRPDLFAVKETPVTISDIKRVSPTKYEISVSAERPFMITLDSTLDNPWLEFVEYDNLWSAFVDGREYSSLMVYPSINSFYIDDSGFLDITIEYKPPKWFIQGAIISVITIIGSVGYLLWQEHERVVDYLVRFRTKVLERGKGSLQ